MTTHKRYVVMRYYGSEGWSIQAEADSILEAVKAREASLANGGGVCEIFEWLDPLDAYCAADYRRNMPPSAWGTP